MPRMPPTTSRQEHSPSASAAFEAFTPPVGINAAFGNGPLSAFKYLGPPRFPAGKILISLASCSSAVINSVGVIAPGMASLRHASAVVSTEVANPGLTRNSARIDAHLGLVRPCNRARSGQNAVSMLAHHLPNESGRIRNRHGDFDDGNTALADCFHCPAGFRRAGCTHHGNDAHFTDSANHLIDSHPYSWSRYFVNVRYAPSALSSPARLRRVLPSLCRPGLSSRARRVPPRTPRPIAAR